MPCRPLLEPVPADFVRPIASISVGVAAYVRPGGEESTGLCCERANERGDTGANTDTITATFSLIK